MSKTLISQNILGVIKNIEKRIESLERRSPLPTYTTSTLPSATTVTPGTVVFVSDGGAGAEFQGSNGTSWVNLG